MASMPVGTCNSDNLCHLRAGTGNATIRVRRKVGGRKRIQHSLLKNSLNSLRVSPTLESGYLGDCNETCSV